jgi:hypothetical protein
MLLGLQKGKLLSVFDGKTEYTLSKWTVAKHGAASWVPIYACYYVYQDPMEVRRGEDIGSRLGAHSVLLAFSSPLVGATDA